MAVSGGFGVGFTTQASCAAQRTVPTFTTPLLGTVRTLAPAVGAATRAPAKASTPIAAA